MSKHLATYLLSFILLVSIGFPSFFTTNKEISRLEVIDVGEEEKKGKESSKDVEVKTYCFFSSPIAPFIGLKKKKQITFYSKNYLPCYNELVYPPPELYV